jgi:hypothetical protein
MPSVHFVWLGRPIWHQAAFSGGQEQAHSRAPEQSSFFRVGAVFRRHRHSQAPLEAPNCSYHKSGTKDAFAQAEPLRHFFDQEINMRRIFTLGAAVLFMSAFAFAETYMGTLVDATCASQQKDAACNPNVSTTAFAVQVSGGKTLRLDAAGNKKAAQALKESNSSADRAKDPNAPDSQVTATIEGTLNGDEIKVDSIEVH